MNVAILPAAGSGKRVGGTLAKQFLPLAGTPILLHTLRRFDACAEIGALIVALQASEIGMVSEWLAQANLQKPVRLVVGGAERSDSIYHALLAAREFAPQLVAVHDAVRPFVTVAEISAVIAKASETGAAILAQPATDTIKEVAANTIVRTVERTCIFRAQTPQVFRYELLLQANEAARNAGTASRTATDDAWLVEQLGHPVAIVEGSPNNFKITTPSDLLLAEALLNQAMQFSSDSAHQTEQPIHPQPMTCSALSTQHSALRIGLGNDIHQLVTGRKLILGGVELPFERGLQGHSDADALSHAITDALLGAAGLGDIGQHFSDQDPRWQGTDSLLFLQHAQQLVNERGYAIANIDATIMAEQPKMMPHLPAMQARLCETLGITATQLNLKAKTNEKLDAIGRGEAIAVQAVVLLQRRD